MANNTKMFDLFQGAALVLLLPPLAAEAIGAGRIKFPDEARDLKGRTWRNVHRVDKDWWERDILDIGNEHLGEITDEDLVTALTDPRRFTDRIVLDDEHNVFMLPTDVVYVNVYDVGLVYGGPEEGGWWYNAMEPVISIPCSMGASKFLEMIIAARYADNDGGRPLSSVASRGHVVVEVEDLPAERRPKTRPHYE